MPRSTHGLDDRAGNRYQPMGCVHPIQPCDDGEQFWLPRRHLVFHGRCESSGRAKAQPVTCVRERDSSFQQPVQERRFDSDISGQASQKSSPTTETV